MFGYWVYMHNRARVEEYISSLVTPTQIRYIVTHTRLCGVVGYHFCLTHRRSPVQARAKSLCFFAVHLDLSPNSSKISFPSSFRFILPQYWHT